LVEQLALRPQEKQVLPVTAAQADLQHREQMEVLLELLQATQPEAELEIARLIGQPPPPTTAPSSAS
jgi:hypothetical protein